MNPKKITPGHYTFNRYEILKNDNGTWQVTKGSFGDKDYWIDTFDSKKECVRSIKLDIKCIQRKVI